MDGGQASGAPGRGPGGRAGGGGREWRSGVAVRGGGPV